MKKIEIDLKFHAIPEDQIPQAVVFTSLQKRHLENEIVQIIQERMALIYDPNNKDAIQDFLIRDTALRGKLEILQYLLEVSNSMEDALQQLARQQAESQSKG
jgi:hypothetical protein